MTNENEEFLTDEEKIERQMESIQERMEVFENGDQIFHINDTNYRIPLIGPTSPDELCKLADCIQEDGSVELPSYLDMRNFISRFCFLMVKIRQPDVDIEETNKWANIKTQAELYNIWMGAATNTTT